MRKFMAKLFLLATLSLGMAVVAVPAIAGGEDLGQYSLQTDNGPFTYNVISYPSRTGNLFFYPNSYIELDVKNAKYWALETSRLNMSLANNSNVCRELLLGDTSNASHRLENFTVKFYNPEGKEIGSFRNVAGNIVNSFPRDGENYETVRVRIESHSAQNVDMRFNVWDPVDPIIAKPIDGKDTDKK